MLNARAVPVCGASSYAPANAGQLRNENTDWFGAIDRTGFGQEHNVAVSGAGRRMDYRLSLNFLDQQGIIDANSVRRIGLGANYTQRLADDRLNLRFNLRGSRSDDRFTPSGCSPTRRSMGPTQPILDPALATGFYDWPGGPDFAGQSGGHPEPGRGKGDDLSRHRQRADRIQPAVDRWAPGQRQPRLRRRPRPSGRISLPSILHRQMVDGPTGGKQTRYNPKQVNTVLETYLNYTTPRPVGPGTLDLTGGYSWTKTHADSLVL